MEEGDGRLSATARFDEESDEGAQNDGWNGYVDHAEEERLGVIAKYDKGREEGAQIDDWEDPAFPLHHTTDRYGFIHDSELPKIKAEHNKRIEVENGRSEKWLKMRSKWEKFRGSVKLKERTYKGIPDRVRGQIWSLLLDLQTIKSTQRGRYEEMLQLARKYSPDVRQIDLDVNRTYRDTQMFRERFGTSQKSLFNILCAYSVYNSEVGYCQGMSQVAALLLMYLPEEDAFWALAQLMTHHKYGMHGFFIAGFPKLIRFQAHHDRVLQKMLPRLKRHFDKHGVDTGLYTLKWFFQCFLDRVPFELSLRLWDIFLLEGDRVLICGAYTILKIHSKHLLSLKNMDDLLSYIQSRIPTNFGMDSDKAIENYQEYSNQLQQKKLDRAGEPGDEELPKKPFGVIDALPKSKPTRVIKRVKPTEPKNNNSHPNIANDPSIAQNNTVDEVPLEKLSMADPITLSVSSRSSGGTSRKLSPSPPPPPPRSPFQQASSEPERWTPSPEYTLPTVRPSASLVGHHLMDSRLASGRKKVPPPVSPRKSFQTPPPTLSMDGDIPGGETVKIHVPYTSSSVPPASEPRQSSSHPIYQHHHHNPGPLHGSTSLTSRNGFDISKSDPNRIKIDVSSSQSTLIN